MSSLFHSAIMVFQEEPVTIEPGLIFVRKDVG
jgi:hypothetical protein